MIAASPSRGEIWWLVLDAGIGSEPDKTRPAVVVSSPGFDSMKTRVIVPLTTWQTRFADWLNFVFIEASQANGLPDDSGANALQVMTVSLDRFSDKLGDLEADLLEEVVAGIALVVEYSGP